MEDINEKFKGAWLYKEIFELGKMPGNERIILGMIINLEHKEKGCYASNKYFAKILHIQEKQVSKYISKLFDKQLITSEILIEQGNKRILRSLLITSKDPTPLKRDTYPVKGGYPTPLKGDVSTPKEGYPTPLKGDAYNKDYKKENKKDEREMLALSFLKENEQKRYNAFIETYQPQIIKFDKFLLDFNDTVEMEKIPFEVNRLFTRWKIYARNYINNQERFDPIEIKEERPTYLRKIL